ncbi:MAG TPA: hopanoid-associated sugar epimerase [Xanthobacteraceae bacterium]|nr:hopanoid-associated sugar epimerase [Xanthobacteraceae bacterium]
MAAEPEGSARDLILVTGASGFLGAAIANSARAAGYAVRVLVRSTSPRINIHREDEIALGDLRDGAAVAAALRGVRYLIHAAADYRLWAPVPDDIVRNNVEGTRTLMQEALRAGVERIVYTSSVATIGHGDGKPADESRLLPPDEAVGAYKKSKVLAERLVHEMVVRQGLPAVVVNPSTPIGPRDVKPTPTGRIIVEAARGRMPGFVDTGLNLVHVDDVAAGHLAALHRGKIGERYILGGENVHLASMLADIAQIVGRSPPRLRLPLAAVYPIAWGAELWARLTGREPFATRDGLRMAHVHMFFSDAKARRDLGYVSRPYREGIADAISWFRAAGYLP